MFDALDSIYKTDPEKSAGGIPIEVGTNKKGEPIIMWVSEANHATNEKFAQLVRKYERAMELSRRNPARRKALWIKIVADSILMKWEGVLDQDDKDVPATLENKIQALTKYDELMADILGTANDRNNFLPDDAAGIEADTEKNSETSSAGS
jgi:hypothetical protein